MNVTMKSKYELEEYIPKYIKANSEGHLESILSEIGGLYTVELKVSGVVEGTVNVKTKKFYSDEFATKLDITTAGSYIIDITEEDNYLTISSEDTFTDLVIDVVLKKKIIVNDSDSLYQGAWDASTGTSALPTPSEDNKGYWYRVSVAGNGYVVGDITVSNGTIWEHFEIGNYELDDYVKKDGSTPITQPQKGVDGVDADDFATVGQSVRNIKTITELKSIITSNHQGLYNLQANIILTESLALPINATIATNGFKITLGVYNLTLANTYINDTVSGGLYMDSTGRVLGTLANKTISPEVFGALGDGLAQVDSLPIQTILELTKDTGVVLVLKPSKYYILTSAIIIYSNQHISAVGANIELVSPSVNWLQNSGYVDSVRTSDISIIGGTWLRSNSGAGLDNLGFVFHHHDRLVVRDAVFNQTVTAKYVFALGDTTSCYFNNLNFDVTSDCIHLQGKNYNTTIDGIYGSAGDDIIGVTTVDYIQYKFEEGDIDGLFISNLICTNETRVVLLGNTQYTIKNVLLNNIQQNGTGACVSIGDGGELAEIGCEVDDIKIYNTKGIHLLRHSNLKTVYINNHLGDVDISRETNGSSNIEAVYVDNMVGDFIAQDIVSTMQKVNLKNIIGVIRLAGVCDNVIIDSCNSLSTYNAFSVDGECGSIKILNSELETTFTGADPCITLDADVSCLEFINCSLKSGGTSSYLIDMANNSYIGELKLINTTIENVVNLYNSNTLAQQTTDITLDNSKFININRLIELGGLNDINLTYTNLKIVSNLNTLIRVYNGQYLSIKGASTLYENQLFANETDCDCFVDDAPIDISLINMTNKTKCYNTNSSLSCDVGYVICDGSKWTNILTGATYIKV